MQYSPPPYMAGPPQPESPTQGEADDDSGPRKAQKHTSIRDAPSEKELRQILEEQEVGKFDFDRDFGVIKTEEDFEHRLWEYETMDDEPMEDTPMEDDELERRSDFPVDFKIQRHYVLKVAKAILNMDGATDTKIKDRKRASKSQKPNTMSKADVPAHKDHGDKEKNSTAVIFLSGLKLAEVELVSWKVVIISRDAQEGRLSRGRYGSPKIKIMPFGSWKERIECIIECLRTTKNIARSIIREGNLCIKDFVAAPKTKMDIANRNRTLNCKRAEEKDAANKAKGAVLREEKGQSHSPIGTQNILVPTGSPRDESTPNSLESSCTRDGSDVQGDVGSSSSTAKMQKKPSAIPRESSMGGRKTPSAASNNGIKGSLTSMGEGGKQPAGLLVPSLVKISSQGGQLGPGDKGFLDVAQPNSQDRNGPATSISARTGPSTQENGSSAPTDASPTAASALNSTNTGNNREAAWSPRINDIARQAISKFCSWMKQQSDPSTSNVFTPESVGGEFSPPALPTRRSSKNNKGLSQSPLAPTTSLSPSAGLPSSAIQPLPSATMQRLQSSGSPSSPGSVSFQDGISGTSGTPASAKKRPHILSRPPEDYGSGTRSASASRARKRQKRCPTRDGSGLEARDIEREEDDDDDEDEDE